MVNLNNKITYSINLSILIVSCLLLGSYYNIRQSDKKEFWVKHTSEVLIHTARLQINTGESGMYARAFILLDDAVYIPRYRSAQASALKEIDTIKKLTADNSSVKPILDSVSKYIAKRFDFSTRLVNIRQRQGLTAALNIIQSREGMANLIELSRYLKVIENNENRLMGLRKAEAAKASTVMNVCLIITIVMVLIIVFAMIKKSRRETYENDRLLEELVKKDNRNTKAESLALLGSWTMHIAKRTIIGSSEMYKIWGLDGNQPETPIDDFVKKMHPDDQKMILDKIRNVFFQTENDGYTFRLVDNGNIKYLSIGVTVSRDKQNSITAVTGYIQDITEKTLAAVHLKEVNRELLRLFNRVGEVLFARDVVRDKFILISDTSLQLVGYTPGEFITNPDLWLNIMHPDDRHIAQSGNELLALGQIIINQYRIIRKDGVVIWVENRIVPTISLDNELLRIDAVIRDITAQKLSELEREKIIAQVVQRNQTLEQFTYIVSHSIRAPVATIMGLGNVLAMADGDFDIQKQVVNNLLLSVNNLDHAIKDLNMILQVRDQVNDKREIVNFDKILNQVQDNLKPVINKRSITITSNFNEVTGMYTVGSYMYSIFYNLIINSINYSRKKINVLIQIEALHIGENLQLKFTDNGKGIDLEKNGSKLFGLYHRFDQSIQGKGMGLFMVKTQVEALDGTIQVKSEVDEGTSFTILLPFNKFEITDKVIIYHA